MYTTKENNSMTITELAGMTGLELVQWLQSGRPSDVPSIDRLLGLRFDEVEHGRVVVSLDTRPDFANPLGTVHAGIAERGPPEVAVAITGG
jgi:hypothetical protein